MDFGREKGIFPLVLIQVKGAAKRTVFGLKNKREKAFLPFKTQLFHIQVVRYAAPEIIEALRCLTHAEEESYDRYIARIKGNPLAVAVKLNDLTDNMDIRRLPYLSDKDVKRLKRYLRAYKQLTGEPTYSVYACRQEYPNAYLPWTEAEDLELTRRWCEGATEEELSAHFQRKPGAIRSRIEKLDLERLYGKPDSHD